MSDLSAEKVVAELRALAEIASMSGEPVSLFARAADLIAQQAATIAARDDELIGERWHADEAARQRDAAKAALTAAEAEVGRLVAEEREACAKLAYDLPIAQPEYGTFTAEYCDGHSDGSDAAQAAIAAAIRARACLSSKKEG